MLDEKIENQPLILKLALDSCPDLIFVKAEDFRITYANRSMLELYAPEKRSEVVGFTTAENFTDAESEVFFAADREALASGRSERLEKIVDYRGRTRFFSTVKTRFVGVNGRFRIMGVSSDVTKLVEREAQLQKMNDALQHYAGEVAHDFINPLSAVSMITELIRRDPRNHLTSEASQQLEESLSIVGTLVSRVRAVLLMCKADINETITRRDVSLRLLVERVEACLKFNIISTNARLECHEDALVRCDPVLAQVLLQNIIENSLKYRSDLPPVIVVSLDAKYQRQVITVADNGVGIDASAREIIFHTGVQLNESSSGAGLGLGMCQKIVALHGGTIWAEESGQGGTKICFTLEDADSAKTQSANAAC